MPQSIDYLVRHSRRLVFSHPMHGAGYPNQGMFERSDAVDAGRKVYRKGGTFDINGRYFRAVIWEPHAITVYPTGYMDIFSFDFGGCVMASYAIRGALYGAHIHMGDGGSLRKEWIEYLNARPGIDELVMFCPDDQAYDTVRAAYLTQYPDKEVHLTVAGLITCRKECFTIYLNYIDFRHSTEKEWELVAYKEHFPRQGRENYAEVLTLGTDSEMQAAWNRCWAASNSGHIVYAWEAAESLSPVTLLDEEDRPYRCSCCI